MTGITGITPIPPQFRRFRDNARRNLAGENCHKIAIARGDSPARTGIYSTMTRSLGPAGFTGPAVAIASTRLRDAVAASLAIASLSLCLTVILAMLSSELCAGTLIPLQPHF
jgi:hypothetical protein